MRASAPPTRRTPRTSRTVRSDGPVNDEPGEGAGGGPDGQLSGAERGEVAGAPVLDVVGRVSEATEVLAAEEVAESEKGFMWHAQQATVPGDAPDLFEGPARLPEVLQDFEAKHEVVAVAREGQLVRVGLQERHRRTAEAAAGEGAGIELDPVEARARHTSGQIFDDDPFTAPDLEDPSGPLGLDQIADTFQEPRHQPSDDGIRRAVLTLVVTARRPDRPVSPQSSEHRIEASSALRAVW